MSIYLLEATRKISHREPLLPITRQQLYNMLIDYGAFRGSSPMKYAVKNIIFEGFWSKAAELYNVRNSYEEIGKLKSNVISTFGYNDDLVNTIFNAIWNVDDWSDSDNDCKEDVYLHFEGIPIQGKSFTFVERLIQQGYQWNHDKNCLVGRFQGIDNCEIRCNTSNSEVPLYRVEVKFPDNTENDRIVNILNRLQSKEATLLSGNPYGDYFIRAISLPPQSFNSNIQDIQPKIIFEDPTGHGMMIESFIAEPHNNLATID